MEYCIDPMDPTQIDTFGIRFERLLTFNYSKLFFFFLEILDFNPSKDYNVKLVITEAVLKRKV